jgi:hypothetical protein
MSLADHVHIARRFQQAIRIDTDLRNPRSLDGFACPRSSAEVLLSMARHVSEAGQMAFTWTGPYGTGKSSLALALGAVLGRDMALRAEAARVLGKNVATPLLRTFPLTGQGWSVLPVIGRRAPVADVFGDALVRHRYVGKSQVRRWTDDRVLSVLEGIAAEQPRRRGGLLILLDEMGKLLEGAARDDRDIFLFQQIAELAARSKKRLLFVGILHRAFDEYANELTRDVRDEWAKVQGRYIDFVVSTVGDEQLALLAQAIQSDRATRRPTHACQIIAALVHRGRPRTEVDSAATLQRCWPLHPVVACLLGPLSRRRFGQNQRSLFGFLTSAEAFGFQEFLRDAGERDLFDADRLWRYLQANLEPAILASPDGHRWSTALEAIRRCEVLGGSHLDLQLLRTVALIDLFRERSGLDATPDLLRTCAPNGTAEASVSDSLKRLREWSLVLFRKHLGAYGIYAGSDFDIEVAVAEAVRARTQIDFQRLRALAGLQPIVAKRHYHETGALRWFDVELHPLDQLVEQLQTDSGRSDAVGRFVIAVPTAGETRTAAEATCCAAVDGSGDQVAVGLSNTSWHVVELAREFLAMNQVAEEQPALSGDAVARREVLARLADLRARLEVELQAMTDSAVWWTRRAAPTRYSYAELNGLASELADRRYSQSPRLSNELLNREQPSSNAIAAQKELLKQMVLHEGEERVGIRGYPAEGGLFDSLLLESKLYQYAAEGWRFAPPEKGQDPDRLLPAWRAAEALLELSNKRSVPLSELYSAWSRPPYGVKRGLMPVLAVAFFLSRRDRLALYREGVFQSRFTDIDVDYLTSDPSSVQFRWVELTEQSLLVLEGLADVARQFHPDEAPTGTAPIDVARALVAVYEGLKPWTKRTSRLSPQALRLRNVFKKAADPNRFLFDDLPALAPREGLQSPELDVETIVVWVRESIRELTEAYPAMLTSLRGGLLAELQVPSLSEESLAELRARAENIRDLTGDLRLSAFVARLAEFSGTEADMEGLASLATNMPPRDWLDADLGQASVELADFAQRFMRAEAYARVQGRPDKRQAMAIIIGVDGRPRPMVGDFEIMDTDHGAIEILVKCVEGALVASKAARREIILAALAQISARYLIAEAANGGRVQGTETSRT